jgi:amino acid adenylation domain-containing protein
MKTALMYADAPALYHQERVLTFEQLHQNARQLANCLIEQGVRPGNTVSLCLSRTPHLVIAMLAVLYTGACYVPIDPEYPAERVHFIINDSIAVVIITEEKYLHLFAVGQACINMDAVSLDEYPATLPVINYQTQLPAYIIYTSGTTGQPKGVIITYQNMLAFLCWCMQEFADTKAAIIYAGTSVCFDLSIFEIFYPLVDGKPLRLLQNGLEIEDWLAVDENVLLNTVPAMIANLLERKVSLQRVAAINMAGEPIPAKVINGLDMHRIAVRNLYGPTEDTTYSTCYRFSASSKVLIGKPIANTHVYLLDNAMHLVPVGVPGEVYLGGAGVAAGYLNRAALTAERFLPDLFQAGKKMYKTGDLARLLPNGELDYLGRKDDQAKIRGYRVEPAEVQSLLETHQDVEACVCVVQAGRDGGNTLVGYVVPVAVEAFDEAVLMQFLKERLPAFMLPSQMVQMQEIPRTPNGKVDKKALPSPTKEAGKVNFIAPGTPIEKELAAIWKDLMHLEAISVHDDFFTLGGHSLLAAKLITIIQNKIGIKIPLIDVFEHTTIAKLARLISAALPFEEDVDQEYLEVEI